MAAVGIPVEFTILPIRREHYLPLAGTPDDDWEADT